MIMPPERQSGSSPHLGLSVSGAATKVVLIIAARCPIMWANATRHRERALDLHPNLTVLTVVFVPPPGDTELTPLRTHHAQIEPVTLASALAAPLVGKACER
jgi:hypothetical protein